MNPVRIFLAYRSKTNGWSLSVFRDLESLREAWRLNYSDDVLGVFHVGLSRPNYSEFDDLFEAFKGAALFSASAKYVFNHSGIYSNKVLAFVDDIPYFIATSGWGYEIDTDSPHVGLASVSSDNTHNEEDGSSSWIHSLKVENPADYEILVSAKISSDEQYLESEKALPFDARIRIGYFRFNSLLININLESPSDVLSISPPWIMDYEVKSFDMPVRPKNVLAREGAITIGDVAKHTDLDLRRMPNMGIKSVADIALSVRSTIVAAYEKTISLGPDAPSEAISDHKVALAYLEDPSTSLVSFLETFLATLDSTTSTILRSRMGFKTKRKTLREIGDEFGFSHERVRQKVTQAVDKACNNLFWRERLEASLLRLLSERDTPVPLWGLEILDPWFKGANELSDTLAFIFEHFGSNRLFIIDINDEPYIAEMSSTDFNSLVKTASALLEGLFLSGDSITLSFAKEKVRELLSGRYDYLSETLFSLSSKEAYFSTPLTPDSLLLSYGRNAPSTVHGILADSDRPLHLSEIHARAAQMGKHFEARITTVVCQKVGLLFGRGTYGLMKHVPLSDSEIHALINEVEDVVCSNPDKQWHCSELYDIVCSNGCEFEDKLTPYIINIALIISGKLANLKRMTWASPEAGHSSTSDRIDIRQAIESILLEAGKPLLESEIRERISQFRGVASLLQIIQAEKFIRMTDGRIGLLYRDVPLSDDEKSRLLDTLYSAMTLSKSAIHLSTIKHYLHEPACIEPRTIFALATSTGRFTSSNGYLYPSEWEKPSFLKLSQALELVMTEHFADGAPLSQIREAVQERLGRKVSKERVYNLLGHIGGIWNEDRGVWTFSSTSTQVEED